MRYVGRYGSAIVAAITIFLSGCQKKSAVSLPNPDSTFASVTSAYPAVVKVILPQGQGLCTGTFVSPRAVLTAAHCLLKSGTYQVMASFGTFSTSSKEKFGAGVVEDPNDIGILYFDRDVADPAQDQVMAIGSSVREGDTLRLIGYGCNDLDTRTGSGVKRTGTNMVYQLNDYIEFLTPYTETGRNLRGILGPSNRSGSCFGDSGGPAAEVLTNGKLALKGVTHAGGDTSEGILSQYVDMSRSDNRNFVASVNSAHSLGIDGF